MKWICFSITLLAATVSSEHNEKEEEPFFGNNFFAADIFEMVAKDNPAKNVIISPAAMQISLCVALAASMGKTANEIQRVLRIKGSSRGLLQRFSEFEKRFSDGTSNTTQLYNGIYIDEKPVLQPMFRKNLERHLSVDIQRVNFKPPYNRRVAHDINKAIQLKTEHRIRRIVEPHHMKEDTDCLLLSAISFRGLWKKAFDSLETRNFKVNNSRSYRMKFIGTLGSYRYGEFDELNARVVEVPFQQVNFSMLIILPNKIEGLREVEESLARKDLLAVVDKGLSRHRVDLWMPRFSIGYGLDLKEPLEKLGLTTLFSEKANLRKLFRKSSKKHFAGAHYGAYIEINARGYEPPLQSRIFQNFMMVPKEMLVDHPFMFVVRQLNSIIFMGHIADYAYFF